MSGRPIGRWSWIECPSCGKGVPSFKFAAHRETCTSSTERAEEVVV